MKKRVLLLYITNLSGHYKAAKAIKEAFIQSDPDIEVFSIDILKKFHPYASVLINFIYSFIVRKIPFLWGNIYDKKTVISGLNPWKRFIHACDFKKFSRLIEEIKPQAVISTQAFPCGLSSHYKKVSRSPILLTGVITDFWPNGFWFYDNIDYYILPYSGCKPRFLDSGIPEEKLKTFGIPIMPEFSGEITEQEAKESLRFDKSLPLVLIMGGGSGLGPIEKIISGLDKSNLNFQIAAVCGKNKNLYRRLRKLPLKKRAELFSYTNKIHKLMSASDIIITKPGGITVSEALNKKLAIIAINPIPGQESNNLKVLLKEKAVLEARNPEEAVSLTEKLLRNRNKLKTLSENTLKFSTPGAALKTAGLIIENING